MTIERIANPDNPDFEWCMELYTGSFPYEERRDLERVKHDLSDTRYFFLCFKEEATSAGLGFFTYWDMGEFLYGEHFAVNPSMRGGGIGARILEHIRSIGKPVILEIEKPENGTALRRLRFYERNGFVLNSHTHLQPPYHKTSKPIEMRIMTWPETFSAEEYECFRLRQKAIVPHFFD